MTPLMKWVPMLKHMLPDDVFSAECRKPVTTDQLFAEERMQIAHAVHKRQLEYSTVRWCARQALNRMRHAPVAVLNNHQHAPCWPAGIAGSMTHCDNYYAAALTWQTDYIAIGIDAEPHKALPAGVLRRVSNGLEQDMLAQLIKNNPHIYWDTLFFSIKESIFKAWYPLTLQWLDFQQATVTIDARNQTFAVALSAGYRWPPFTQLRGAWRLDNSILVSALLVK